MLRRPHLLFRKPTSQERKLDPAARSKPPFLTFSQLPKWYQDNPYILTRYRPVSDSYHACIHSLTYLHNETLNIYTHLLPALVLALLLPTLQLHISRTSPSAPWTDRIILTLTPLAALATFSLSTTYHVLMNHSPFISASCLLADYSGILLLILASFVSGIYVGFYDSAFHQRLYFCMIGALVLVSCLLVLHPGLQGPVYRARRTAAFVATALSGFAPVLHGVVRYGWVVAYEEKGVKWWLVEGAWPQLYSRKQRRDTREKKKERKKKKEKEKRKKEEEKERRKKKEKERRKKRKEKERKKKKNKGKDNEREKKRERENERSMNLSSLTERGRKGEKKKEEKKKRKKNKDEDEEKGKGKEKDREKEREREKKKKEEKEKKKEEEKEKKNFFRKERKGDRW
ncbi:Hly-III related protein [Polyplosphaeria fusca]|uniref:Hly-III related protein n=1 Tax=Polyplosphaeria fusca TaxID=682080 RepID=A0A9P4QSZ0_9PLEO|nr:Hly-III related protein [Polyplosphaeria fusca]